EVAGSRRGDRDRRLAGGGDVLDEVIRRTRGRVHVELVVIVRAKAAWVLREVDQPIAVIVDAVAALRRRRRGGKRGGRAAPTRACAHAERSNEQRTPSHRMPSPHLDLLRTSVEPFALLRGALRAAGPVARTFRAWRPARRCRRRRALPSTDRARS